MNTRTISTSVAHSSCDVCGRTLLRGERAEVYVNGGARHSVCELCSSRARAGGWVREGTIPAYGAASARLDRRRSLLHRLRSRRETTGRSEAEAETPASFSEDGFESQAAPGAPATPPLRAEPAPRPGRGEAAPRNGRSPSEVREPRHVRAVPTSVEHKISSATELFNGSEHPRTVAGIARSLGLPEASVLPAAAPPSVVNIVLAWELCWYRYEVDLSDEVPGVRVSAQGYELAELAPEERCANATADHRGQLSL